MKILAIADVESKYLWDYFEKSKLEGIDLIISCGDLDPRYLSFLATFTSAPVLYVHGNHGFKIFLQLIEKYHPKFFLHGHVHMSYGRQHKRYDKYMDTYVINAFDRCVFEFETEDPEKDGQ